MECLLRFAARPAAFANDYGVAITALATVMLTIVTRGLFVVARQQIVTSRAQLRAYVAVQSGQIEAVPGKAPKAQVTVKNYGLTPAYKFRIVGAMGIAPSFETLPPPTGDPRGTLGVLAPSGIFQWYMVAPKVLSDEAYAHLAAGNLTLFVYGEVHYEDAFGVSRVLKYRTMFGGPAGIQSNQLASCADGNEAD
jgi:hypothetical protein